VARACLLADALYVADLATAFSKPLGLKGVAGPAELEALLLGSLAPLPELPAGAPLGGGGGAGGLQRMPRHHGVH
jgi:hypothetical protein